jgi:hypothetical protein
MPWVTPEFVKSCENQKIGNKSATGGREGVNRVVEIAVSYCSERE